MGTARKEGLDSSKKKFKKIKKEGKGTKNQQRSCLFRVNTAIKIVELHGRTSDFYEGDHP